MTFHARLQPAQSRFKILIQLPSIDSNKSNLNAAGREILQKNLDEFDASTTSFAIPYGGEINFHEEILQQQGNVQQATEIMSQKFPQMNFAH